MSDSVTTGTDDAPDVLVVRLQGDFQTGSLVRPVLDEALARGDVRIALDLSGVEYVGSGGLAYMLGCVKRARERGGDVRMFAPSRFMRRTFAILGLGFPVYDSEEEAVRSFAE